MFQSNSTTIFFVFVPGFGIYFEWTKSPTTEVTVHVAESDEDDEEDADDDEYPVGDGNWTYFVEKKTVLSAS